MYRSGSDRFPWRYALQWYHRDITDSPARQLRPLLKWVGGKRQLLPELRRFYPLTFNRYIEPFFGSGAVFFDLERLGRLRNHDVVLIDANVDLIGCYESVRNDPEGVASALEDLGSGHSRDEHAHYYEVRDRRFNPLREARRRPDGTITSRTRCPTRGFSCGRDRFSSSIVLRLREIFCMSIRRTRP